MVRRSSRLRDKANAVKGAVPTVVSDEKDEEESLESLVQRAYAVIKQKVDIDGKSFVSTETGEEDVSPAITEDYLSISSKLKAKVSDSFHTLASELNPGLDDNDLYFKMNESNAKPISSANSNLLFNDKEIMQKCVVTPDFEKKDRAPPYFVSHRALQKQRKTEKEKSAGSRWFNMPAPEMTAELQRDLNIIRMRGILDPKRHYKKNNSKKLPKYFQIGTVVNGPAEFYSSRIPKSERKGTIIDSLLSDVEFRRYNKRKYLEIQATKEGRKRGFYKRSKKKRR